MILIISSLGFAQHFYKYLITTAIFIGHFQICHAEILNINETASLDQLKKMILIDASNISICQKESVKTAKCIPIKTFQSEQGELASFYHITWVLGTSGIKGSEELLVFADDDIQRDALVSLLYLAGQKKVWRWKNSKSDLQKLLGQGKGQARGIIRSKYYTARMRDKYLVLPKELELLKKQEWQITTDDKLSSNKTVIIGNQPLESLARFTRLLMKKTKTQMIKILIHSPTKLPQT